MSFANLTPILAARVAQVTGCPPLGADAIQQGLAHLDINHLVCVRFNGTAHELQAEPVLITNEGRPLWNELSLVRPPTRRCSPRKNVPKRTPLLDLHAAQIQRFRELTNLIPIPMLEQLQKFIEVQRGRRRILESHNALMKDIINVLEEKKRLLSAQMQAVEALACASGSRKLSLNTRTSALSDRLGVLDSRRKSIEGRLELLMLEQEEMLVEEALSMQF